VKTLDVTAIYSKATQIYDIDLIRSRSRFTDRTSADEFTEV